MWATIEKLRMRDNLIASVYHAASRACGPGRPQLARLRASHRSPRPAAGARADPDVRADHAPLEQGVLAHLDPLPEHRALDDRAGADPRLRADHRAGAHAGARSDVDALAERGRGAHPGVAGGHDAVAEPAAVAQGAGRGQQHARAALEEVELRLAVRRGAPDVAPVRRRGPAE